MLILHVLLQIRRAICTMICIATLLAVCSESCLAQKSSLQTPKNSSPKIPSDGKPFVSYDSQVVFDAAASVFRSTERDKLTRSVFIKNTSQSELFIPFEKELLSSSASKQHFNTLVSSRAMQSKFIDAKSLGLRTGDILVLEQAGEKIILVYAGNRKFPDGKYERSFFLYPYLSGVEYNTFPPRIHTALARQLKQDVSRLKFRKDDFRSWLRSPLTGTQSQIFMKSRWRTEKNARISVYRIKEGSIPVPRFVMLKRPEDLRCHHQTNGRFCSWACLSQCEAYVTGTNGLRALELKRSRECLFDSEFRELYRTYLAYAAANEVRAILRFDTQLRNEPSLGTYGFTEAQIAKIRGPDVGFSNQDAIALIDPTFRYYEKNIASGKGSMNASVFEYSYQSLGTELMQLPEFSDSIRRLLPRVAQSGISAVSQGDTDLLSVLNAFRGSSGIEKVFVKQFTDAFRGNFTRLFQYYSDAAAVSTVWSKVQKRRRTKPSYVSTPNELKSILLRELEKDRPVIVGLTIHGAIAGSPIDGESTPIQLRDAFDAVVFSKGNNNIEHAVVVVGYADSPGHEGYVYFQDGLSVPKGNPSGSTEVRANFVDGCRHIFKMRISEFCDCLHKSRFWDYGDQWQDNVETLNF